MKKRLVASLTAFALMAIVGASSVMASHVTTEYFPGNPPCDGTKIEPVADGTYALPDGGTITIDVYQTANGPVFDFDTDAGHVVSSILVKGGPNALLWTFNPPVSSFDGLHSPLNPNNGKWYGLSHLCIQSDKKDDPEPPK